jgi:hypothetical protein
LSGVGFQCSSSSVGSYQITFATAFSSANYAFVASPEYPCSVSYMTVSPTVCNVFLYAFDLTPVDYAFNFIAFDF